MPRTQLLTTPEGEELRITCASREELVSALRADYPFLSRMQIQHWVHEGRLRFEGREARECFLLLTAPEAHVLRSQGVPPPCAHCAALTPIVYADSELLVLNKPAGLPTRPALLSDAHSALQAALTHAPELALLPEQGLLHRLDSATSGLLAFARKPETHQELRRLWSKDAIHKSYEAIVHSAPHARAPGIAPGMIDLEIGHSAKSSRRMIARTPSARDSWIRGRWQHARTEILTTRPAPDGHPQHTLVRVRLHSGVRHQIRVHLAASGHPIVGDPLYSRESAPRLMLHACELILPDRDPIRLEADWSTR